MSRIVSIIIAILFITSCVNTSMKEYCAGDFRAIAIKKQFANTYQCSNEKEAIETAGAYIYVTTIEESFPSDYSKWGSLAGFIPFCFQVHEIDSVFSFSNYIPGGFGGVPCQIDANFRNGKTIRFCFNNFIFDPDKIDCKGCPDHPQYIMDKYSKECN